MENCDNANTAERAGIPALRAWPLHLSLRPELETCDTPDGDLAIQSPGATLTFKKPGAGLRKAFSLLKQGGHTADQLCQAALGEGRTDELARFIHHFEQLSRRGLLRHTVAERSEPIASIIGISPQYLFRIHRLDVEQPYTLSRFACCRRDGKDFVLECPLGHAIITLHDWRAGALLRLAAERLPLYQLRDRIPGIGPDAIAGFYQLLANANALTSDSDDSEPVLSQWSFHDLLFHSRSRFGRHSNPFGATFRHIGRVSPLPAVRPALAGPRIELYTPDLDELEQNDPPLAKVMETRRSVYDYDEQPISARQLGEFLYRVARVRSQGELKVRSFYVPGEAVMETTSRPYPAGGKCYELELYLIVDRCEGLAAGVYHYEPLDHCLTRVSDQREHVDSFLRYAAIAAPNGRPQVLISIAARCQRVSWKYDGMAYALTLKHVGVLYQTMYLAATAMGLGPCALGSGDADLFASVVGANYYSESSVGEFMLGSLRKNSNSAEGSGK
ncbi:MAG TPA: SagB family peptide dehydrogenase [Blastocatellia bacterium]|nr:SagB family peptide dehydrogenase [Blastocatellia bacterium]